MCLCVSVDVGTLDIFNYILGVSKNKDDDVLETNKSNKRRERHRDGMEMKR